MSFQMHSLLLSKAHPRPVPARFLCNRANTASWPWGNLTVTSRPFVLACAIELLSKSMAISTSELKSRIIASLNLQDVAPEQINDEAPLFGAGLGLDSIDALEL